MHEDTIDVVLICPTQSDADILRSIGIIEFSGGSLMTISPEAIKSKCTVPDRSMTYSLISREEQTLLVSTSAHLSETNGADCPSTQHIVDDIIDSSMSVSNDCGSENENGNKSHRKLPTLTISAGDSLLTTAEHSPSKDREGRSKDLYSIEEPYHEKEHSCDDESITVFTDSGTGTVECSSPAEFQRQTEETVAVAKSRPFFPVQRDIQLAEVDLDIESMKSQHETVINTNIHTIIDAISPSVEVESTVIDIKNEIAGVPIRCLTEVNDNLTVLSNHTFVNQLSNPHNQQCQNENENENGFSTEHVLTIESYVIANHLKFLMKWTSDDIMNSDSPACPNPEEFPFIDISATKSGKKKVDLIYESSTGVSSMIWKIINENGEEENINLNSREMTGKDVKMRTDNSDNSGEVTITEQERDFQFSSLKLVIDTKTKIHQLTIRSFVYEETKKRSQFCHEMISLLENMNYRLPLQGKLKLYSFSPDFFLYLLSTNIFLSSHCKLFFLIFNSFPPLIFYSKEKNYYTDDFFLLFFLY